jgi:hypothetical protein
MCCVVPASARAGLYNTADAPEETPLSWDFVRVFSRTLGDLRSVSAENPERQSTLRKRYQLMEALGAKGIFDLQSLEQQLDYSVVLIRRNRADEAIVLLTPLTRKHGDNFIVYSHFATAHFLSPNAADRDKAAGLMRDCLQLWPKAWEDLDKDQRTYLERTGWSQPVFDQNRKYEEYLHKLMKLRRKSPAGTPLTLDNLFGTKEEPVRFIGANGKYEPGRILADEKKKLPGDAIEIVEQLLVWMPNDLPLYWLLGEVFNASAMDKKDDQAKYQDIKAAHLILREITGGMRKKDIPQELADHQDVLAKYIQNTPEPGRKGMPDMLKDFKIEDDKPADTAEISYRQLSVAFVVGLMVGMFAIWQVQELRRRRQARAHALEGH